ncbi:MAG TPA: flavodoxin family protein [Kofleriaceae bacterium]|nr:flavodoxin family protein [Kofleriaceae bacterium]
MKIRHGSPSVELSRDEFRARFRAQFVDPAFERVDKAIALVEQVAWEAYAGHRKAPRTRKAGPEFADPDYDMSIDWLAARDAIRAAQVRHDTSVRRRILVVAGGSRNEHTCPGEQSKTQRLADTAVEELSALGVDVDMLDLSRVTAEYGRTIHPCKGCVSTAMPLCHWPCSCYPNHGLGQTHDWMHEIYPLWVAAHGIAIITPVYWHQAPSPLKLMIDRLVCADGGNPDPSTTHGKTADEAKKLELQGWPYPRHLAGRAFAVIVHGDAGGTETLRRDLTDWLVEMELEPAGPRALIDRYIGYYEPYATSHDELDDSPLFEEARNAMRALVQRVDQLRREPIAGCQLEDPRPK